jgi:LPS-assembly lipoprotein
MRGFIIIAMTALLAGCGFTPMYAEPETSGVLFKSINYSEATNDGRTGYWLENALRDRLTAENAPDRSADMSVTTAERRVNLGVLSTDRATRADLYLTVAYRFTAYDPDGAALKPINGTFTAVATYNISASPYAEITALADARRRAAEDAADRIARDIAFKTKKK